MNSNTKAEEYIEKYQQLVEIRKPIEKWWQFATDYVMPKRAMWDDGPPEQVFEKNIDSKIYDTYPQHAHDTLRNGMVAYNSGPHSPWFKLKISVEWMNEITGTKDWLEQCETIEYMLLHRFGFYDAAGDFEGDLSGVGIGTCIVEENIQNRGIVFDVRHPRDSYVAEGTDGRIDTNYCVKWMTARAAYRRYGERLPDIVKRAHKDKPSEPFRFLHVLEPREDAADKGVWSNELPVASVVIQMDENVIVEEKGFYEMPAISARWENWAAGYGWGPVFQCMADIIRLQKIAKSDLEGRQMFNKKPLNIPKELRGKEKIVPGGYNYYDDPNRRITAIDLGGTLPTVKDLVIDLHASIDRHLYTNLFLMLQGVERDMTAREVVERKGEQVAALSNPLSKQNSEFLKPVVSRVFNIASRAGWLPSPPPALIRAWLEHIKRTGDTAKPIDMDFIGLLAQAQRRYLESQNINAGLATISAINQQAPQANIWDNFDLDDMSRGVGNSSGFRQSSIREIPDRDKIRAKREAQTEALMRMEMAERASKMIPNLQKASDPGSPAEVVMNQISGSLGK